jgi:hypothetical protein
MTQISIRNYSPQKVLWCIILFKWVNGIYDGHATTLDGAFKLIKHNLKWDYREYERDNDE